MEIKDLTWEEVLEKSYGCYLQYGARSTKKLYFPHLWIRETLKKYLGNEYKFYSYGWDDSEFDKEYNVQGIAYKKRSDITVLNKNNDVVGVVSFKFISSNYSQNSNNYFENLLGECFNIQAKKIPFCHILVIRDQIPYYNSNQDCNKIDKLKNHHLDKYIKIKMLDDCISIPKKISINVIKLNINCCGDEIITPKLFESKDKNDQDKILKNIDVKLVYEYENCSDEIKNYLKEMEIKKILKEFSDIIKS